MATRTLWRVRQGSILVDPKSGAVVAYAGQDVAEDHPAVLAHPSIASDCFRIELDESAPAPALDVPAAKWADDENEEPQKLEFDA